ncbi:MAG TPA: hypothetical protein DCX53_04965, partial [Anaerolineae bacterium]|nr:hypothetical protein [Anaerolineae bacterium]
MRFTNTITKIGSFFFSLTFIFFNYEAQPNQIIQRASQDSTLFEKFGLLTPDTGWISLDQRLFQTIDSGLSWYEIGPVIPVDARIQDIEFLNIDTGWILWTKTTDDGGSTFTLAHTIDRGATWSIREHYLFDLSDASSQSEKADMGWIDSQNGWIAVKKISSSNFSLGTLFKTSDGGSTWRTFPLPAADRVTFHDNQLGWAVGGPTGNNVFQTKDGGSSWQDAAPDLLSLSYAAVHEPVVVNGQGLLIVVEGNTKSKLSVYTSVHIDSGWSLYDQVPMDVEPGIIGLSILDQQNFVATIPGSKTIVRMKNAKLETLESNDDRSMSIVDLDMLSTEIGWARSVNARCVTASPLNDNTASVSCESHTRLLQTRDGGSTWQEIQLPNIRPANSQSMPHLLDRSVTMSALPNLGNTEIFIGQGFDKCEIPPLSQLQTWWDHSPYKTVNLYIGGSSRACSNSALTATYVDQMYEQGWKFIPTWVGPQAPCTGFLSRMSNDVATAYNQGVEEANLAVERLSELGLTYSDKSGSIAYYDIEYYGTNTACRAAVNSFMDGWVSQMHVLGNLAGVYGSTLCNTGLSDFLNITNVPDAIWPARWYHNAGEGYYDPDATVWNLGSCLPNTEWADHQRIRQYEGDHNETWGGLTLGIDSNVLDGIVAIPYSDRVFSDVPPSHP